MSVSLQTVGATTTVRTLMAATRVPVGADLSLMPTA